MDEVAIVIGIRSCVGQAPAGTCNGIDPTHNIGQVIFKGPFDPQVQAGSGRTDQLQSVTVHIPDGFPQGPALITVAHFALNIVSPRALSMSQSPKNSALTKNLTFRLSTHSLRRCTTP